MSVRKDPPTPYDPACAELAEHFLNAEPPAGATASAADYVAHVRSLAIEIQRAVEGWYDAHPGPVTETDEGDEDA